MPQHSRSTDFLLLPSFRFTAFARVHCTALAIVLVRPFRADHALTAALRQQTLAVNPHCAWSAERSSSCCLSPLRVLSLSTALKVFRNGKPTDYNGPRKADGIVSYMKKQVGPAARTITTDAELKALMNSDPAVQYAVVAFVNEGKVSQLQSSFSLIAARLRDEFAFGRTSSEALKQQYGVPAGSEAIVTFLRGEQSVYEGGSKTGDVEAFIREHSLPLVGEYSDATAAVYAARNLPVAKLFLNVDRKPGSKTMVSFWAGNSSSPACSQAVHAGALCWRRCRRSLRCHRSSLCSPLCCCPRFLSPSSSTTRTA